MHHCNGALRHIKRLDFSVAAREGKSLHSGGGGGTNKRGIRSHGAYALSRLLTVSHNIEEIYVTDNKIGPYGASRYVPEFPSARSCFLAPTEQPSESE